jgi:phosphoglycolate phosphatase
MIGDTTFDILMACNAGTASIGVSWGVHEPDELRDAGAHRVAETMEELPPVIDRLIQG